MATRDIIAVGASAGGVEALSQLVGALPGDLEASMFVVLHLPAEGTSMLPTILNRSGALPAAHPADAEHIRHGRIYVAPPDRHLLVMQGRVHISPGPRENGHRPAIDPLFRSMALAFGPRVIAVVLSGTLDDGSAGLEAVRNRGGRVLVQDPDDAVYRGMPDAALRSGEPDAVLPVAEIGDQLVAWTREEVPDATDSPPPQLRYEANIARFRADEIHTDDIPGVPSVLTCPECQGVLWEVTEADVQRFRCRVGHAYTAETLALEQANSVESALWSALRALEERSALAHKLAERMKSGGHMRSAGSFERAARETEGQAEEVRRLLLAPEGVELLDDEEEGGGRRAQRVGER